ncbi:MAG: beta strand repeat-containing protein [Terracidiphilus sp.]
MSLGVLNNLSALYAENNLNNTNNSLNTVLQQLSSGSKINSGADDAAGLSLVDGLQANQSALMQSETNATEGVGLLQVADGALSQVTSLLNRAVTLATEASNGTLNTTQDTAANQEYQSILSEVSNIGSTTTYNQEQVFDSNTNIYTGDSSSAGSSIDDLNIRTLSSSNLGDTNGTMAYSNGQNNVFIDLSDAGQNAAVTDSLGAADKTTTVSVGYLTTGANGSAVQASANISVGAGTNYANTAQGLIGAINNSGLGVTASFGTAAEAGTGAATSALDGGYVDTAALTNGADTGIIISGQGVGVNTDSSSVYTNGVGGVGTLTVSQVDDTLGGTLNVTDSSGQIHALTLGTANSTDTLANLMATINNSGWGLTASLNSSSVTDAGGTHAADTILTLTSGSSNVSVTGTNVTDSTATATSVGSAFATGNAAASTLGVISVNAASDTLSGVLKMTGDGAGLVNNLLLGTSGSTDTLANLASFITTDTSGDYVNITATLSNNNTTLTFTETGAKTTNYPAVGIATGSAIYDSAATTGTAPLVQSALTTINASTVVGATSTGVESDFASITAGSLDNELAGAIAITPDGGTITQFNLAGYTITSLAAYINANNTSGTFKNMSATLSGDKLEFNQTAKTGSDVIIANGTVTATDSAAQTIGTLTTTNANDALTGGTITIQGGNSQASGDTKTFTLGTAGSTDNLADLAATINAWSTTKNEGVSAAVNTTGTGITFTSNYAVTQQLISGTGLSTGLSLTGTPTAAGTADSTIVGTLSLPVGQSAGDVLAGTLVLGSNSITLGTTTGNDKTDTMADLAATINNGNYGVTATLNSANTAITFKTANSDVPGLTTITNNGTDSSDSNAVLGYTTYNQGVTSSAYYSVGISGNVSDTSTGGGTAVNGLAFSSDGAGTGVATISYADSNGQSLSATDLSNQNDSQTTLNDLNAAIADVAALDGYIGAQINTLNSVSNVLSTQQENVQSAQNAVQATDYASATSNMSKYEILSQTGIAALAQANSMQQEVTKLLQ